MCNVDVAVYLPIDVKSIVAIIPTAYRPLKDWDTKMFFGGHVDTNNGYLPVRTHGQTVQGYSIFYTVFYR